MRDLKSCYLVKKKAGWVMGYAPKVDENTAQPSGEEFIVIREADNI